MIITAQNTRKNILNSFNYSGTSVHELNPFLEAVREPKCS
jgi:hypothetical protein